MLTEPFQKITGLISSYWRNPVMMKARSVAATMAMSNHAMWGAVGGGLAGAGQGYLQSRDQRSGSMGTMANMGMGALKGAAYGGLAGAAYKGFRMGGGMAGLGSAAGRYGRMADSYLDKGWNAVRKGTSVDSLMYKMGMGPR